MSKIYITTCLNCGRTLTTSSGVRVLSANFDSRLPPRPPTKDERVEVEWARCDACHDVAVTARGFEPKEG